MLPNTQVKVLRGWPTDEVRARHDLDPWILGVTLNSLVKKGYLESSYVHGIRPGLRWRRTVKPGVRVQLRVNGRCRTSVLVSEGDVVELHMGEDCS